MASIINWVRHSDFNLLNALMEPESPKKKKVTLLSSLAFGLLTLIPLILFFVRLHSANVMNSKFSSGADFQAYDVACLIPWDYRVAKSPLYQSRFSLVTDVALAEVLVDEITQNCDDDCVKKGTNWTAVYWANGILLLVLILNMSCIMLGTVQPWFNFFGVTLAPCICLAHFIIIIVTGVARYSTMGRLCAITTMPTHFTSYSDQFEYPGEAWTYEKDASMITVCWIF